MIEFTPRNAAPAARNIKIIGIGGAGANALDRMALDGVAPSCLVAVNTDAQALVASVAGEKIQLGLEATRGFGSGGDPELGRSAAEEAATEIRSALEGVEAVFVLAGLGGGTGSGAAPLVAELAREAGALVIAVVTLPFNFEGKRRSMQAADALAALQQQAHAVICFENDRMGNATPPKAGIQMAFTAADQTLSQSVLALAALLNRSGLIHLGFDEIAAVLQTVNARCLFGYGDAEGSNRSYDALAQALKNPLMDKGRMLRDCETVLIQICGGPDLTLDEVQLTMEEFNRHVDNRTRILFGAAVDPGLSGRLTVTILSSLSADQSQAVRPRPLVVPQERVAPVPVAVAPRTRQTPAPAEPTIAAPKEKQPATAEVRDFQTETPVVQETAPTEPVTAPAEPEVFELNAPGVEFAAQAEEPPVEQAPPPPQRPEKPRGLRTATTQISLFGEEPTAPADAPATQEPTAPAPAKIAPPVPRKVRTAASAGGRTRKPPHAGARTGPRPASCPRARGCNGSCAGTGTHAGARNRSRAGARNGSRAGARTDSREPRPRSAGIRSATARPPRGASPRKRAAASFTGTPLRRRNGLHRSHFVLQSAPAGSDAV